MLLGEGKSGGFLYINVFVYEPKLWLPKMTKMKIQVRRKSNIIIYIVF